VPAIPQEPLHTITIRRITEGPPTAPGAGRLGRHVRRDSRSAHYPYTAAPGRVPVAVEHARNIPILDQGDVGSCEGNAGVGVLGTDPFFGSLKPGPRGQLGEPLAVQFYSAAEDLDGDGPYPPNDNGTTNTSICQAIKNAGLFAGYTHVATVADMIDALQDRPVIAGVPWYSTFDAPDPETGLVSIGRGAYVRGGHAFVVRAVDPAGQRFKADNSWGEGWGLAGSFWIPFGVMNRLLTEDGEITAPVPVTAPAPVPVPNPPQPPPAPAVYPADLDYVRRMDPFAAAHHTGHTAEAVHWYRQWKAARGIETPAGEGGQLEPGAG